jgi:hypothetical protein
VIVTGPLHSCGAQEPYAVSRDAAESADNHIACPEMSRDTCDCYTKPEDWTAVCSDHVCERSRVHFLSWPRVYCPRC